ncbi:uncharacterized protein TA09730 [Theileria annulata]|uniref:Uncharacterized protein n=1 Tax=Theileria annulata TaxID=5874 RepID=Q4UJ56_THEAN|nr:uncharacterized protein TA09730 [Theileria annulata]CAI72883.1 hypothetical protein, conserved [Theileria annulata]|eukprot:XP_953561.1 hypothetical protein, conserved [Theileria annulata]
MRNIQIRYITIWRINKPKDKYDRIINEKLYPRNENNITKLWNGIKKNILIDSKNPDEETEKYFQFSVQKLMESPGRFTFRKFYNYLQELCMELKLIGKNTLPEEQITGTFLQLKNQYNMMSYLTDEEFESDNHKIFTFETKKLISNSLNVDIKDVDDMLLHHETCKIDRTWYFRRLILGRKLPTNFKERDYISYQRPSSNNTTNNINNTTFVDKNFSEIIISSIS